MVGTAEVERLLDSISHTQFQRWRAYFKVRDAAAWEIAGRIAAAAWQSAIIAAPGGNREWREAVWREWETFVPARFQIRQPQKEETTVDPKEAAAQMAAVLDVAFGPKG